VLKEITSTTGVIALVALALALIASVLTVVLQVRLKRMRAAQIVVLGDAGERDLASHALGLQQAFEDLRSLTERGAEQIKGRLDLHGQRLDRSISHSAVVRYDAYGELSGRQSSSVALLDELGTGVVMSSILHRDQARMYVKGVHEGKSQYELSPEEQEAIETALRGSR
jgi:hypothetical protein